MCPPPFISVGVLYMLDAKLLNSSTNCSLENNNAVMSTSGKLSTVILIKLGFNACTVWAVLDCISFSNMYGVMWNLGIFSIYGI